MLNIDSMNGVVVDICKRLHIFWAVVSYRDFFFMVLSLCVPVSGKTFCGAEIFDY